MRQTGLNPDDFGAAAFALHAPAASAVPAQSASPPPNTLAQSAVDVPNTRRQAMRSPYAAFWQAAMDAEIASIRAYNTFSVTAKPAGINVVGCRWVFAVKAKDSFVARFKARLVAQGFSQQLGVDYEETYSPVMKYKTLRIILAIVAARDLTLEFMDVQTAYLNAELQEEVYMRQPEGYEQGNPREWVCKLHKAIYGLKQAGREWNTNLNAFILSLGFTRLSTDTCVYVKRSKSGRMIIISTYVDDIPSAFDEADRAEWESIKARFLEQYKIQFLGESDWFLNMRLTRDRSQQAIFLDQRAYLDQLLQELQLDECRTVACPSAQTELAKADCPASEDERAEMSKIPYRHVVGALTYLANATRPDIAHAVNRVAQFAQNPGAKHWRAVQQILRYLSGTRDLALRFHPQPSQTVPDCSSATAERAIANRSTAPASNVCALFAFADASWANCPESRRSTTGWLLGYGGSWIDWCVKKQETVALSSCEAEYMALTSATQAVMWTRSLLKEIESATSGGASPIATSAPTPLRMFSDNKSAIDMARNDTHHQRSKHIDLRHHFIREQIQAGTIAVQWVSTHDQLADIFTKPLTPMPFVRIRDELVVRRQSPAQAPQKSA